jgi:hypothetical protein
MPAALDLPWDVIRAEFSQGVTITQLVEKYGVAEGTLCSRAKREQWMQLRPQTHAMTAMEAQKAAAKAVGMTLAEAGQAYAARMFEKMSRLSEAANLQPPKNYKDAEIADKIARRAAGLENADVSVQTIIGVSGFDEAPVLGAEVVTIPALPAE